jgi:hypothetical protein
MRMNSAARTCQLISPRMGSGKSVSVSLYSIVDSEYGKHRRKLVHRHRHRISSGRVGFSTVLDSNNESI